jgi:SAM-dependent methyltransferase
MIDEKWNSEDYINSVESCFKIVDQYLDKPPVRILDIGCGFAGVSELFQKKYGTEIWLLDGDSETTKDRPRKAKYGEVSDFKFYMPLEILHNHWKEKNLQYTFIDANNIEIPKKIKFDLVYSWLSCGYHYPIETYKNLILEHTDEFSKIILDFRRKTLSSQLKDFDIINYLEGTESSKRVKLHIKVK